MNPKQFLAEIRARYRQGDATEHTYRSALEQLFKNTQDGIDAINEPKRVEGGAPDFIIKRGDITVGHIEAKDLDIDLGKLKGANTEQKERYVKAFPNLIYTNCLDFIFYRDGHIAAKVCIGELHNGDVASFPKNFNELLSELQSFLERPPYRITTPEELANIMAHKAALIKNTFSRVLKRDAQQNTELMAQYETFKQHLIRQITTEDFADIYAETIAYGMFAARLNEPRAKEFSRQQALRRLPESNPFLRKLFGFIAGENLDERVSWVIDDLAEVFGACDMAKLMVGFGEIRGQTDPFIHFYEDFLKIYNPKKKKLRGVWYTPEAVVNFIVRAVDDVLKTEFHLPRGLADTSKIPVSRKTGKKDLRGREITKSEEMHRVQILDPAVGTGTFLAEVIKQIAPKVKKIAPGMWSEYIEKELIPRLHGFECLMASYAMCHVKLNMELTKLGYILSNKSPRLSVYLTNSLEEGGTQDTTMPFAQWLADEANEANQIKSTTPIMCVIGNPPYRAKSVNKGAWIEALISPYKKEPGGIVKLEERNPRWVNDDYVKFIRLAEHMLEKNGEGILGFITNHGYLDNPTFRGIRWHLLKTFDKIYVLDLHGNSNKKEVAPDGSSDKNVFDIQQGVAIILAVKKSISQEKMLAKVFHTDLWGKREEKYNALWYGSLSSLNWTKLENREPVYYFAPRNHELEEIYKKGFSLTEFMPLHAGGMTTAHDEFVIGTKKKLLERFEQFKNSPSDESLLHQKFSVSRKEGWNILVGHQSLQRETNLEKFIKPVCYRPFDMRYIFYHDRLVWRTALNIMKHFLRGENIGLATARSNKNPTADHFFLTKNAMEAKYAESSTQSAVFPLYKYVGQDDQDKTREVNFDSVIHKKLVQLTTDDRHGDPDELDIFDYIYGVLHSPTYRKTFSKFLKTDFARIPYPKEPGAFWSIAEKGEQLRRLHLMEEDAIGDAPYPFKGDGDKIIQNPKHEGGEVWINKTQFFEDVPEVAWRFLVGGYQPAQKWLKDRKGECLRYEDVTHYQKIIKILSETDRIMTTIEMEI